MKQFSIQASIRVTDHFDNEIIPEALESLLEKWLRARVPNAFTNEVVIKVEVREVPAVVKKSINTKPKSK